LATIPEGDDVISFLSELEPEAWVSASGWVTAARFVAAEQLGGPERVIDGRAALLSLQGPARGPLMALLVQEGGDGRVRAGRLIAARSAGVSYAVPGTGAGPAVAGKAKTGARPKGADQDEEADELPVQGDRIDHFVFGLSDVMVVQGERFKIREVGGGKLREIHVGPFRLSKPVVVDGKRVFKLVKRS
jgi:hypothetical protein